MTCAAAAAAAWRLSRPVRCKNPRKAPYRLANSSRLTWASSFAAPPGVRRQPGRQAASQAHRSASGHSLTGSDRGEHAELLEDLLGLVITPPPPSHRLSH